MNDTRAALIAQYHAAVYEVRMPGGGRVALRIGRPLPSMLRQWLAGDHEFAFITAHNPCSQVCSVADNRRQQRALLHRLSEHSYRVLVGVSRASDAEWREASLFVAAIDVPQLDRLAREFRQNAVLAGRDGGSVELRLCRDDWLADVSDA